MEATGLFTKSLWEEVEGIYNQIVNCDFVTGLSKGTLSENSFKHYLSQDILYIKNDTKALAELALRASKDSEKDFFKRMSDDCMEIENILHNDFLDYFKTKEAKKQSPAFSDYSEFILEKASSADYPIAVAALLPCFWLYGKVGHHILENQSKNNKYQKFIDTYAGDEYISYTKEFIQILEINAVNTDQETKEAIIDAFIKSSKYELLVFEEAVRI